MVSDVPDFIIIISIKNDPNKEGGKALPLKVKDSMVSIVSMTQ